jgi:CRP/FNR family cyclic AMP-dependent transcriptional regulator
MENLERMVAEHPFIKGLDQPYIQLVTGCASNVRFSEGDFLFRDGEEANAFYIIRQGRVAIETYVPQRGSVMIDTYGDGISTRAPWSSPGWSRSTAGA